MPIVYTPGTGADFSGPLGFFGASPTTRRGPYTNTYSTTNWTLGSYTANVQTTAYTGGLLDLLQAAMLTDLNTLRVAVENLRVFVENVAQQHGAMVTDMKTLGLVS